MDRSNRGTKRPDAEPELACIIQIIFGCVTADVILRLSAGLKVLKGNGNRNGLTPQAYQQLRQAFMHVAWSTYLCEEDFEHPVRSISVPNVSLFIINGITVPPTFPTACDIPQ